MGLVGCTLVVQCWLGLVVFMVLEFRVCGVCRLLCVGCGVCDCCVDDLCCRLFGVGLFCCEVLLDRFSDLLVVVWWYLLVACVSVGLVGGGWVVLGLCLNLNAV